jgi:hypothetical protein
LQCQAVTRILRKEFLGRKAAWLWGQGRQEGGVGVIEIEGQPFMQLGKRAWATFAAAIVALALIAPATAGAQDRDCTGPTGDQYCPQTQVLTGSGSGEDPGSADPAGGLPFTGFDIALSLAAGVGLLGAGLALRHAGRSRSTSG